MSGSPIRRRLVRDLSSNRVGEVMDENRAGDRLFLRPVGGGREWEVDIDRVVDLDSEVDRRAAS
jgi:hypothetical protein